MNHRDQAKHGRGALLLEALLALSIFVSVGSLCLLAAQSLSRALLRAQREHEALDLSLSKLAELEAGLVSIGDLRGEWSGAVGSLLPELDEERPPGRRYVLDVRTSRSEFRGLSLVELTVREVPGTGGAAAEEPFGVTVRRLLPLRRVEAGPYEEDELLEGLPEFGP